MEKRFKWKILFYIKRTKLRKTGAAPIYFKLSINSENVEVSTGLSIPVDLWSSEKGGAKGLTVEAKKINKEIEGIQYQIIGIIDEFNQKNIDYSAKSVRDFFMGKFTENSVTILKILSEHNEKARLLLGKDFAYTTVKKYESCFRLLKTFIQSRFHEDDYSIEKIDHGFITGFEFFLKSTRNCEHNSAMKYIKILKKIIRLSLANGIINKDPFINYKISIKKVDRGFLSEQELNAIKSKEIQNHRLNQIKDCFLFCCYTGLSYSDLRNLNQTNLYYTTDGHVWIKIQRVKTGNSCNIPLLPVAQKILEKYQDCPACSRNNELLPVLSNQKYNQYLKELANECGIKRKITSHLARHTFATTVTLNNDIPIESVSKMLGHSSINMTKIYARLLDKKIGQDMEKLYEKYKA